MVEKPHVMETSSITSSDVAEFVRQATEDDADSYFESFCGPLGIWGEQTRESRNDLNEERGPAVMLLSRDHALRATKPLFPTEVPGEDSKTHDGGPVTVRSRTGLWRYKSWFWARTRLHCEVCENLFQLLKTDRQDVTKKAKYTSTLGKLSNENRNSEQIN